MDMEQSPFDLAPMAGDEVAKCVAALIRSYGAHAGMYLMDAIEQAETDIGKANWFAIGKAYAARFELIAKMHLPAVVKIAQEEIELSERLH